MGVVIPVAGTVVPMLVSMFVATIVPMLVCVDSIEPPVAAIAAGEPESRYCHENRRGGFGCVHLHFLGSSSVGTTPRNPSRA
jgi:hypothetical protein